MSFFRRAAAISVVAITLAAGGAAPSAFAAPSSPAVDIDGPGGRRGHDRPMNFGPFEVPRNGHVTAGFAWGTSNRDDRDDYDRY
ncbi:hypothetical protein AMK26_06785 [Streptomyces sp. CB03234]|uniref:hypothetical protein n=1 Tax=Streptomyces sp. (strain CB03234) TaxID=1703937 RepID=UPI00093EF58B|nr:hypothetical protein [Streptomyces sp. CB03234]OKK05819.1 hypothetical protein AMK26_06785 [Streptomyces sp. CB03234]